MNKQDYLNNLRHSCAHLLAKSVKDLWPGTHNAIGPAIENGFYQDFDFGSVKISDSDLPTIEEKMKQNLKAWDHFDYKEVTLEEAKKLFADNPYKLELAEEFAKGGKKLLTNNPGNFLDLCKMTHIENPKKEMQHFKLLSVAGAYWRGSEKNKMLTRIYGTIFPTKEELEQYLWQQEEAKKRDHKKLGRELEIFTTCDEIGQGLILWLPNGTIIKDELEGWAMKTETKWGYERVSTPNITKSQLYYTSGHLPYYKDDMYPPMSVDKDEQYYLKPMNCPHHHMIYKSKQRSYRDLPLRLAEYGTCYRYESSGELYGMMRVRGFTQNDAHIYCTEEQAIDEFRNVIKLHEYYYRILGIKEYYLELALRDPHNKKKYHGDDKMWERAEELMRLAVKKTNIPMVTKVGNAAFYGPKIDFIIKSAIGREFAASTNQIDLFMGKRFNLSYTDESGKEQIPVIIHRAPLGSSERLIGFLIEHYGGKFPLWLSPVQIKLIPITDRHVEYTRKIHMRFLDAGIRAKIDERSESMQARIRDASLQKIPFTGIIGDKEVEQADEEMEKYVLSVRSRSGESRQAVSLNAFIEELTTSIEKKL